jgi:hypothetical protein
LLSNAGSIRLPTDPGDDDFIKPISSGGVFPDGSSSSNEGFYGVITGASPSTTIATLRIGIAGEFRPIDA